MRDHEGNWTNLPASYLAPSGNGQELWRASYHRSSNLHDLEFVVRYEVAGQVYWDNNNGQNYYVAANAGVYLAPGFTVLANSFAPYTINYAPGQPFQFYGSVAVQNIDYAKSVTIVYSTDGWQTVNEVSAQYSPGYYYGMYSSTSNPNQFGVEVWTFNMNLGYATEVEYAIRYEVNGQTFWDNNNGLDYYTEIRDL